MSLQDIVRGHEHGRSHPIFELRSTEESNSPASSGSVPHAYVVSPDPWSSASEIVSDQMPGSGTVESVHFRSDNLSGSAPSTTEALTTKAKITEPDLIIDPPIMEGTPLQAAENLDSTKEERKRVFQRRFAAIGIGVVALHVGAMYLWIAPENAMSRAVEPLLESYALPVWQQSWSLFAPTPVHSGFYLEVRAVPEGTVLDELPTSQLPTPPDSDDPLAWQDASAKELEGMQHNLLPSTAINITNKLASGVSEHVSGTSSNHQDAFSKDHTVEPWNSISESVFSSPDQVTDSFNEALIWDRAATAYATQFLRATGSLSQTDLVQYQIYKVSAPPFAARKEQDPQRSVVFTSGLRPQTVIVGQDEPAFRQALESF